MGAAVLLMREALALGLTAEVEETGFLKLQVANQKGCKYERVTYKYPGGDDSYTLLEDVLQYGTSEANYFVTYPEALFLTAVHRKSIVWRKRNLGILSCAKLYKK